jgi:GTPase SAR1 family protein
MSEAVVKVAVVGHTNTGKTSLLRTLMRDVGFGEVSDRPAVTRHVEGAVLLVEGRPVLELYDTPGLEDSMSLLEHLDHVARGLERRPDWVDVIAAFVDSPESHGRFAQEAKALRQVLASDAALYVIDVRDRVLGKHRDELEILSRCARPVVPVLNFTASDEARTSSWRDQLARLNLHAVAEFDTVIYDQEGERRLFEKLQSLLDQHRDSFAGLIDDRRRQRHHLVAAAARLLADMLIDVTAYVVVVPTGDAVSTREAVRTMKEQVGRRERACVGRLLELFSFRPEDGRLDDLPIEDGRWGLDLFSPEAMKHFGIRAGGAAAAGAVAGLAVDAMSVGITMGAATATGAAIGALLETGRSYGRKVVDRVRGLSELRCADATVRLLEARQVALVRALMHRGHAAMEPVVVGRGAVGRWLGRMATDRRERKLPAELRRARSTPRWSALTPTQTNEHQGRYPGPSPPPRRPPANGGRDTAVRSLAQRVERQLMEQSRGLDGGRPTGPGDPTGQG